MCLYMFSALSLLLNPFLLFRLNDIRAQKVKYSRLAREKEQEIGMNTILIHVHICIYMYMYMYIVLVYVCSV